MGKWVAPKNREDSVIYPEDRGHHGLCAYCAAASECSFVKASGPPVVQCEEFEALRGGGGARNGTDGFPHAENDNPSADREPPVWERTGLCGNCENCGTCAFPKEEGGVWRCEEYR